MQYAQALQQLKSACERMQREDKIVHTQQMHRVEAKLKEKSAECDEYKSKIDALTVCVFVVENIKVFAIYYLTFILK